MKTILYIAMIFALLAGSLAACQPAAAPIKIDAQGASKTIAIQPATVDPIKISAQDAGKTITMKTGDTLIVTLDGNITTGFNWIPAAQNPALLNQLGDTTVTSESNAIGAPGKIVLQFKAVAQGQTVLHLDYKRSWETDVTPEKTFEVTIVVK